MASLCLPAVACTRGACLMVKHFFVCDHETLFRSTPWMATARTTTASLRSLKWLWPKLNYCEDNVGHEIGESTWPFCALVLCFHTAGSSAAPTPQQQHQHHSTSTNDSTWKEPSDGGIGSALPHPTPSRIVSRRLQRVLCFHTVGLTPAT